MAILAIIALLLGVCYGLSGWEFSLISYLTEYSNFVLYALMFLVGISVGLYKGLWQSVKTQHFKILVVPTLTILASVLGGLMCGYVTGYPLAIATAIGSSMGWYSLAGITIGDLAGATYGSVAFLSNLMREIFSFLLIPLMAAKLNHYSCVAAAGATSEDTTLPMLIKYADEQIVLIAVINGMVCSTAVPMLISICATWF